jgi:hypothetical protein
MRKGEKGDGGKFQTPNTNCLRRVASLKSRSVESEDEKKDTGRAKISGARIQKQTCPKGQWICRVFLL